MRDPKGWAGADGAISGEVDALFQYARPTRGMTEGQRLRMNHAVQSIAATPVSPWPFVMAKNVVVAAIGITTAGALVGSESGMGRPLRNDAYETAERIEATPAVVARIVEPVKPHDEIVDAPTIHNEHPAPSPAVSHKKPEPFVHKAQVRRAVVPPVVVPSETITDEKALVVTSDDDTLKLEIESLEKARRTLASSPTETLAQLDDYQKEFPAGRLSLAREVLAIDALLKLGRKAEARIRAEALLASAAGTPYAARVRKQLDEAN